MNRLIQEVSKDLFINAQHFDNPFAQESSQFYVRLVEIRDGWVAYLTCTNSVKFAKYEQFFNIFTRPEKVYGKVCTDFATATYKELQEARNITIKNPWAFGKDLVNYKATEFLHELRY